MVMDTKDERRFVEARDGDFLLTPFQCDLCHFRNLHDQDPIPGLPQDAWLLKLIRRANLDTLWSREPGTVSSTLMLCKQGGRIAKSLGIRDKLFRPMGPHPLDDTFGMAAAIVMLQQSLNPGRNDRTAPFATVRKLRGAVSNAYHASAVGQQAMVMAKETRKMTVTKCPTYGEFFKRFMRGMHKRMGEISKPDRAISSVILREIQHNLERDWDNRPQGRRDIAREASFYLIAFCCALRGEEVPMVDLYGTVKHWEAGEESEMKHLVVPLLGRFKG